MPDADDLAAALRDWEDPIVRYKARRYLDAADPASAAMSSVVRSVTE